MAVEGLSGDLAKWRAAGIKEQIDKHYQRFGLKYLVMPLVPEGSAYNVMLKEPVGPSGGKAVQHLLRLAFPHAANPRTSAGRNGRHRPYPAMVECNGHDDL